MGEISAFKSDLSISDGNSEILSVVDVDFFADVGVDHHQMLVQVMVGGIGVDSADVR